MTINKDGFLAKLICWKVDKDRKRFKGKEPQPFLNEKKQLWYFMLEQMERAESEGRDQENNTADKANKQ